MRNVTIIRNWQLLQMFSQSFMFATKLKMILFQGSHYSRQEWNLGVPSDGGAYVAIENRLLHGAVRFRDDSVLRWRGTGQLHMG